MKIQITFSAIVEVDDFTSRNEAFDIADEIAEKIHKSSGVVVEVYDVDPVEESR